ncbi:hypothetical protein R84B8_02116 [Treponema sp. R8-4-B8]
MLKLFNLNIKNIFLKNVLMLTGGAVLAQVINFLLSPVITRLYTPEDYGILSVYSSILGLLVIISSLKYEFAIVIADNDETAINIVGLCLAVLLCIISIIIIILFFAGSIILIKLKYDLIIQYKYFIPLGVFLLGLYNIFSQWAYRRKNIKSISKTKFTQALFNNVIKIFLGFGKFKATGLILGTIAGESAGLSTLSIPFFRDDYHLLKEIKWHKIKYCAKRYINFPLFTSISQLFNQAGLLLPSLLILSLYDGKTAGFYGLANTVLNLPMILIGNSIGDVFYTEAASFGRNDPKRLKELSNKLFKKLFIMGLIPLIILLAGGPFLFGLIFGKSWIESGYFARIMAIIIFSRLIFMPISRLYSIFEKQKEAFIIDLLRVILVLAVYYISKYLLLEINIFIILYAISMSFIYFLTFLIAQNILNNKILENNKELK